MMFFLKNPSISYKRLVVHAGSGDQCTGRSNWSLFRDVLTHCLYFENGGFVSLYKGVNLFINGSYWGIYWLRERIDDDYIEENFGFSNMDLLKFEYTSTNPEVKEGDDSFWKETYNFFKNGNLRNDAQYAQAQQYIDIDNFIDYNIFNIFIANGDWPHNNVYIFRNRSNNSPWRWIMWDTDAGWDLPANGLIHNTIEWATRDRLRNDLVIVGSSDRESWLWSTVILRKLLSNDKFKTKFINRFADLLNTSFASDYTSQKINNFVNLISPDIDLEEARWEYDNPGRWDKNINRVRNFARRRPQYVQDQLINKFNLSGTAELTVLTNNSNYGSIRVNSIRPSTYPWSGTYFEGNPVTLTAIPNTGYRFVAWAGANLPNEETVELNLNGNTTITAIFAATSPFINVNSPNGGEIVLQGQTYQIQWSSFQAGTNVEIEFSSDNGLTWQTVISSTPNNGSFQWTVPNVISSRCLIKISDAQDGDPFDISDGVFSIIEPDNNIPIISNVSTSAITGISATITWQTDEPANSQIEYGLDINYGNSTTLDPNLVTFHSQTISNLVPNTTYYFRVMSADASGNLALSEKYSFTTNSVVPIFVVRVNVGGNQYTGNGKTWAADQEYTTGSWGYVGGRTYRKNDPIANTTDDVLYQSERYRPTAYRFTVPTAGTYQVNLHFAEIFYNDAGKRRFDVSVEGTRVLNNLDIFATVGHDAAMIRSFNVDVTDGVLDITFTKIVDSPKISAIEIVAVTLLGKQQSEQLDENENQVMKIPEKFSLSEAYPNPFNLEAQLRLELHENGHVAASIYNLRGQKIIQVMNDNLSAGYNILRWNGRDNSGQVVSSGIYLLRLVFVAESGIREVAIRRFVLMK